jgi:hypothetical protein
MSVVEQALNGFKEMDQSLREAICERLYIASSTDEKFGADLSRAAVLNLERLITKLAGSKDFNEIEKNIGETAPFIAIEAIARCFEDKILSLQAAFDLISLAC